MKKSKTIINHKAIQFLGYGDNGNTREVLELIGVDPADHVIEFSDFENNILRTSAVLPFFEKRRDTEDPAREIKYRSETIKLALVIPFKHYVVRSHDDGYMVLSEKTYDYWLGKDGSD